MKTIKIYRSEVVYDIDALTYKRGETDFAKTGQRPKEELKSDGADALDRGILFRVIFYRDARLRRLLEWCLVQSDTINEISNRYAETETSFVYTFKDSGHITDDVLLVLTSCIHRYLVFGGLYDWYRHMNVPSAVSYSELDGMETEIAGMLRRPSSSRRPLQPFGPEKFGGR